jgi:hypothetical protein
MGKDSLTILQGQSLPVACARGSRGVTYKISVVACFLCATLLFSGCASIEGASERLYRDLDFEDSSLSGVAFRKSGSDKKIFSVIRTSGDNAERLVHRDLETVFDEDYNWGRLKIVSPRRSVEMVNSWIDSNNEFLELAQASAMAIGDVLAPMRAFQDRKVAVAVFAAPSEDSYVYSKSSHLSDIPLEVLVASPGSGGHPVLWWLGVSDIVLHELTHINHEVIGETDLSPDLDANSEAAAEIIGACAKVRFVELTRAGLDDPGHLKFTFESQGYMHLFPELENGEFNPNMTELVKITNTSTLGAILGAAAVYMLTHDYIDFSEKQQLRKLYDYCATVANRIPDFVSGQTQ